MVQRDVIAPLLIGYQYLAIWKGGCTLKRIKAAGCNGVEQCMWLQGHILSRIVKKARADKVSVVRA